MNAAAAWSPASIAILGAGAVGSYYGARLVRAGAKVTLIGRPAPVEAISRQGLVIVEADGEWRVDIAATTDAEGAVAAADLVLVTVKSPDTAAAVRGIARALRPGARLVSMQNGVDNAERIAGETALPVYAAVVYVGTVNEAPGRVRHTGRGDLVLGVPRALAGRGDAAGDLAAIAALFGRAGIACPVSHDIESALWSKLVLNAAFNAISALGNARYGTMAEMPPVRAVMEDVVRETVAVARADGAALDAEEMIAGAWKLAAAMGQQLSSTAQDLARGKATEIDALNGFVAQRGATLGVPTPVNRTLHALVKLREQGLAR